VDDLESHLGVAVNDEIEDVFKITLVEKYLQ
jgi:hypothetical protein